MKFEASIVVSTFNRADALEATLQSLSGQDSPVDSFEVIVVDDGSTDGTHEVLRTVDVPYRLRTVRHAQNRGVSAGRNSGIRAAKGRYVIFLSDDLLVPPNFVSGHIAVHERFPRSWVVGGFRQLHSLTDSPFGRYLDELEQGFDRGRREREVAPGIWEMSWPTARNLSLLRVELDETGLFDERFLTCCEDQDLAERARSIGIRFLFTDELACVHNDQAGDLRRYCRFQERGASDTVLYLAKSPVLHGAAAIARVNGPIRRGDGMALMLSKLIKRAFSGRTAYRIFLSAVRSAEAVNVPDRLLRRAYRLAIGVSIFRGWRAGMKLWGDPASPGARADAQAPERMALHA